MFYKIDYHGGFSMRRLTPKELEIGMIIAEPVKTPLGQLLAEKTQR